MSENNPELNDCRVEQMIKEIEPGGDVHLVMEVLMELEEVTVDELAEALGWTTERVQSVLADMEDRGLIGPPPLGERVYVGNREKTLADLAEHLGVPVEEAFEICRDLGEQGLMTITQLNEYEYFVQVSLGGSADASKIANFDPDIGQVNEETGRRRGE